MLGYLFENSLYIPKIVDNIRQDDGIECIIQIKIVCINVYKPELGVSLTCSIYHINRKINSNPYLRAQGCKQIALSTTYLKDFLSWMNKKPIYLLQSPVIIRTHAFRIIHSKSNVVPMRLSFLLISLKSVLICFHFHPVGTSLYLLTIQTIDIHDKKVKTAIKT